MPSHSKALFQGCFVPCVRTSSKLQGLGNGSYDFPQNIEKQKKHHAMHGERAVVFQVLFVGTDTKEVRGARKKPSEESKCGIGRNQRKGSAYVEKWVRKQAV